MSSPKERYIFIDILKGISILLVVYGHIIPGSIPLFTEYAGIFRMPLFFFVSGVLFSNTRYQNNFKEFLYKRYKGLVIPFFYFSIIVALGYFFIEDDYRAFIFKLVTWGWGGYALWFIPVLLGSQIIYYAVCKLPPYVRLISIVSLGILSFLSSRYIGYIPYNLCLCLCGAYFFGMGNLCKKYLSFTKKCTGGIPIIIFVSGFAISLIYLLSDRHPQWFINDIPSLVFYVAPLGSIACLAVIALLIERGGVSVIHRFFSVCGRQSYIILAFHQIICMIAQRYVPSKIAIMIMIVSLAFLVWFIPKYLPWMLGKSKAQ